MVQWSFQRLQFQIVLDDREFLNATGEIVLNHQLSVSIPSNAATNTTAYCRDHWTTQNDRDLTSADGLDYDVKIHSTGLRQYPPCPWAFLDGQSWLFAQHPYLIHELHLQDHDATA